MNLLNITKGLYSIGIRGLDRSRYVVVVKVLLLVMRKPLGREF